MSMRNVFVGGLMLAGWLAQASLGAEVGYTGRARVLRVAVVTGGHPFDHTEFFQMFDGLSDIVWTEAVLPAAADIFSPGKADTYDVMVWYCFAQPADAAMQQNIQALLAAGKPLLVLHHGISAFPEWAELEKIVGARYVLKPEANHPGSTYKHDQHIPVKIADKAHPITRCMDDFTILDETYDRVPVSAEVTPLLTTEVAGSMPQLGWTRTVGKSNVVSLMLGHGPTAFRDSNYRRLVMQSIRWLGGTLPEASEEGFTPLWNGKDFDGWKIMGRPEGFWIKDGVIRSESHKEGLWMRTLSKDLFNLVQSLVSFFSPPMTAVFLLGVLWKRATGKAAFWGMVVGTIVSFAIGACYFGDIPYKAFWPHYLLLAFYLAVGIALFMVILSLLTKNSNEEQDLPTLREAYATLGSKSKQIWVAWAALAALMLAIYLSFS